MQRDANNTKAEINKEMEGWRCCVADTVIH